MLRAPERSASGYRIYNAGDLENVIFIKWCQQLGFTLTEIRQLLQLHAAVAHVPAGHLRSNSREVLGILRLAEAKLSTIQAKIRLLQTMQNDVLLAIYKLQGDPLPVCPAGSAATGEPQRSKKRS